MDDGNSSPARRPLTDALEGSGSLKLPGRDRIDHTRHLPLEDPAWHRIESDFRLVTWPHPLQGVLLEPGRQLPIVRVCNTIAGRKGRCTALTDLPWFSKFPFTST